VEAQFERDPRVFRHWFALAWASLGDHARTVKWLARPANPAFAGMRNDPEFRALIERIGLM
jgi:hypothetical protein